MEQFNPMTIHGQEWVININRILEEALEENYDDDQGDNFVSIFNVPKTLMSTKPEAYTPQVVALGPYHRRRLELFEMERYKLTSAKRRTSKKANCAILLDGLKKRTAISVVVTTVSWNMTKRLWLGLSSSMPPSCWSISKPIPPRPCKVLMLYKLNDMKIWVDIIIK